MTKLLGAALIVLASAALGWEKRSWYRRRAALLPELAALLGRMEAELLGQGRETEELLALAGEGAGPVAPLFRRLRAGLDRLEDQSLAGRWADILSGSRLPLRQEELEALARLGHILGRYDSGLQAGLLAGLRREIEGYGLRAREEADREGRAALTVGCTLGLLAAILLL